MLYDKKGAREACTISDWDWGFFHLFVRSSGFSSKIMR